MLSYIGVCFLIIIVVNIAAFCVAYRLQTDKLTDITYSISFVVAVVYTYTIHGAWSWSQITLAVLVIIWAIRLGGYLFWRVHKVGKDDRFDEMRPIWHSYIKFWILQALSICVIVLPVAIALLSSYKSSLDGSPFMVVGIILAGSGWLLESVADYQKSAFKSQGSTQKSFMHSGLYAIVRFPNYTGEILFWLGIFLLSIPHLQSWQYLSVISPIWIIILLTQISGIPLLIISHDTKYGHLTSYQKYVKSTSKLVPGVY